MSGKRSHIEREPRHTTTASALALVLTQVRLPGSLRSPYKSFSKSDQQSPGNSHMTSRRDDWCRNPAPSHARRNRPIGAVDSESLAVDGRGFPPGSDPERDAVGKEPAGPRSSIRTAPIRPDSISCFRGFFEAKGDSHRPSRKQRDRKTSRRADSVSGVLAHIGPPIGSLARENWTAAGELARA